MNHKTITTVTSKQEIKDILAKYLKPTDSCIVHTSLSAFGYIPGESQAIVDVLKELLYDGNIVMAGQTTDLTDPIDWEDPGATPEAQDKIRQNMPAFNAEKTPIRRIGRTPEYFRTSADVRRSNHPIYSMCMWGRDSERLSRNRSYDMPFGVGSPLDDLYKLNAKVVMLGTDYESCTALHLADSTINRPYIMEDAPVDVNGKTKWIKYKNVDLDKYDDFNEFGEYFEQNHPASIHKTKIYKGYVRIINMRDLIDAARMYYTEKDKEF